MNYRYWIYALLALGGSLGWWACNDASDTDAALFIRHDASTTGIDFRNDLTPSSTMNIFNYMYFFNGAGVAVGDLNGDDLPDIYFTANQTDNRLYLNRGDFTFQDITAIAGVAGEAGWTTGVNMADVNGDGLLDIYVNQLGQHQQFRGRNQLYINLGVNEDGVPVFENQAERYGLDLRGYATQSAFFDYDLDGDLDMYQLNHSVHNNGTFGPKASYAGEYHPTAGDRLLRNDGNFFTDVTEASGIQSNALGYGLGISVADVNWDGYPDIYVGNDFHEDDYFYLNNGDGTFRDVLQQSIRHTSRFSMGTDIADLDNDGLPEIMSLDMLPADPVILKSAAAEDPYDIWHMKQKRGYAPQFARNVLQWNRGFSPDNDSLPLFSDVALATGMAATDWSWSVLLEDLDNDGWRDVFISNGILGRSNDLDYINFVAAGEVQSRIKEEVIAERDLELMQQMPEIKLPNYAYRNEGGMRFTPMADRWGLTDAAYSHGTVYADLDNDGDLDLVINNVNDPALVYENRSRQQNAANANYLRLRFEGKGANTFGYGVKVIARTGDRVRVSELQPVRGFQSSVDPRLFLGAGPDSVMDRLTVIWPGGAYQELSNVAVNQELTLQEAAAAGKFDYPAWRSRATGTQPLLYDATAASGIDFVHRENPFVEFNREPLMPHMTSAEGPALAVGDVNGDGRDDCYLGGGKRQPGQLYIQTPQSTFVAQPSMAVAADSLSEDTDAVFFDADNDGTLDLLVVSGGNEFPVAHAANRPRLYMNDGAGAFTRADTAIPASVSLTGSCVAAGDYDGDGDTDLFLGARAVTSQYGAVPTSFLLENQGDGTFVQATPDELAQAGMVKDALWLDVDADNDLDLVIAIEWGAVRIYRNNAGQLSWAESDPLAAFQGWWNTLIPGDFDGDGDVDLIAGNLGLNSKLKASTEEPLRMYYADIDDNGTAEQLVTHYIDGREYLFATRDETTRQLVQLKKKYIKYTDFANASLDELFDRAVLDRATVYSANYLETALLENDGKGQFTLRGLPSNWQYTPVQAGTSADLNGDGKVDLMLLGNQYEVNIQRGRYDASYGQVLLNTGDEHRFRELAPAAAGFLIEGQGRAVAPVTLGAGQQAYLVARNDAGVVLLRQRD